MLAFTIQFSKYGQEHQPYIHHTPGKDTPTRETTHPADTPHQQFGGSRPQPPHHTNTTSV